MLFIGAAAYQTMKGQICSRRAKLESSFINSLPLPKSKKEDYCSPFALVDFRRHKDQQDVYIPAFICTNMFLEIFCFAFICFAQMRQRFYDSKLPYIYLDFLKSTYAIFEIFRCIFDLYKLSCNFTF